MTTSLGLDGALGTVGAPARSLRGRALLAAMFCAVGAASTARVAGISEVASLDVPGLSDWLVTRWAWCFGLPMLWVVLGLQAVGAGSGILAWADRWPMSRWGWRVLLASACALGLGGVWYIAALFLSPGHAASTHIVLPLGAGLLACITVLGSLPSEIAGRPRQGPGWGWAGLGVALVVLVVTSQALLGRVPPEAQDLAQLKTVKAQMLVGEGAERLLVPAGGMAVLRLNDVPLLGTPEAPKILYQFFDYTDPASCQSYRALREARERYGDQIAMVMLVFPLDDKINPKVTASVAAQHPDAGALAQLSLAVWRADRSKFEAFNDYLLTPRPVERSFLKGYRGQMVALAEARTRAAELVGDEKLRAALTNPWVEQEIARHIAARDEALDATAPITCVVVNGGDGRYGAQGSIGAVTGGVWLFDAIEKKLDIKPVQTQLDAGDPVLKALRK